jgi:pyruvate, orthophosphate dikinase
MGNRRQRPGHGLRQHRRQLRFRRGFTRNPATGEKVFYGEFLINAQGEDVVAGIRTPEPVAELKKHMPKAYTELDNIRKTLEKHFKDVQDFEFTIQDGKVFMLQTRNGKRTGLAAPKFAMDMVKEKLIDWKTAIRRNPADQLDQVLAPVFDRKAEKAAKCIARGSAGRPRRCLRQDVSERRTRGAAAEKARKSCSSATKPRPKICAA